MTRPSRRDTSEQERGRRGHSSHHPRKGLVALVALGLSGGLVAVPAFALNSNPPTGPGNIEIFPKRDMVAVEGYGDKAGQQATITVTRGSQQVGVARGQIDETGFLEVNHPGGVCWSNVTPNIGGSDTARDAVRVTFQDGTWDEASLSTAKITDFQPVSTGNATFPFGVRVTGTYGADVDAPGADLVADPGRMAVEIVNPEMREAGSAIGERAIGWPSDDVPTGYSVTGSASNGTFTVTYGARTQADQELMLEGDPSVSSWQSTPEGVEAQLGLTIFEYKEIDGPGFGGCPAGPDEMTPDSPTVGTAKGAGGGAIDVTWQAGSVAAAAADISEYRVRAVLGNDEVGKRLPGDARGHTFTELVADALYDIEVTAVSASGESFPPLRLQARAAAHTEATATASTTAVPDAEGQYTEPLVGAKGVTFNGSFGRVHYTTDGSTPTLQSSSWDPAMSPIDLRATTTLKWLAVDRGNIPGGTGQQQFRLAVSGAPAVPTDVQAASIDRGATVTWADVEGATRYDVLVYSAPAGVEDQPIRTIAPATTTVADGLRSTTVTGLTPGSSYQFGVVAANAIGVSDRSVLSEALTIQSEAPRAEAGADQTVQRGATVTLDGSASVGAASYSWAQLPDAASAGQPADPQVAITPATSTDGKATFSFPLMGATETTTDHALEFELTVTTTGGDVLKDTVVVTARPDVITTTQARWRAGSDLRLGGTGTTPGARLTIRDEANSSIIIGEVTVDAAGGWALPRTAGVTLSDGAVHIQSDRGHAGEVQTTR